MNLSDAYSEIQSRIDQVDFSGVWRGFRPIKYALYKDESCFFDGRSIKKPESFIANTSIEYNGEHIAIWDLSKETDDFDALAASIIHEMFHAYQNESGESRWPEENAALIRYRYSDDNISTKLREAEFMQGILIRNDASLFPGLLGMRSGRNREFPFEYDYESRVEQIEGSAKYVELCALAQINAEKGKAAWERTMAAIMEPERYFPIRIISYSVGAAFLACLKRCSCYDFESFTGLPFSRGVIGDVPAKSASTPRNPAVEFQLDRFNAETERIVQSALAKGTVVLTGRYPLYSLNVWDARWNGRYAVSSRFLAYRDGSEIKVLNGDFVAEMDDAFNLVKVFKQ